MIGKLTIVILCVSLLANILFFASRKGNTINQPENVQELRYITELKKQDANTALLYETSVNAMFEQLRNEDVSVPEKLQLSNGNVLDINVLLNTHGKCLVFRFDRNACAACVENELANISALNDSLNTDNIIILASSFNTAFQAKLYTARFNIHSEVYNLVPGNFRLTTENTMIPCYFTLDSSFKASLFFIPDKNDADLTRRYFKMIMYRKILLPKTANQ
jgi:hypothetical protein